MNSKYTSTKKMEKEGQTAGTKLSKEQLLNNSRSNLRANVVAAYAQNKDAPELPVPPKKKAANDIVKKNMEMKKPQTAGPTVGVTKGGAINI